MDLPISRVRQIVAAITLRLSDAERLKRGYVTWQTKALASFQIATAAEVSKEGREVLREAINSLSMEIEDLPKDDSGDPATPIQVPVTEEMTEAERAIALFGFDPEAEEDNRRRAADKNRTGTFEALQSPGWSRR